MPTKNVEEVRDFLMTRRARLTPERAGVPATGGARRVTGLRREEVAMLAQVSTDYYTRLERGNLTGVSDAVLDSVASALQLDEAERTHLLDLARTANARRTSGSRGTTSRATSRTTVRPGVHLVLDAISTPAYVRDARLDVLALNEPGRALFRLALGEGPGSGFNLARFLYLDPRSRDFYPEWPTVARDVAAALRIEAGRRPFDRALSDLVGELATRSQEFSGWWASHDVKLHRTSTKRMHHDVVGDLELTGEALDLPGDDGLTLILYTVEPASPTAEALAFLTSWTRPVPHDHDGPRGPHEGHTSNQL